MIERMDHINIRTGQLDAMIAWYEEVLLFQNGWRPPFPFPGAWLYAGDLAMVHLVGEDPAPQDTGEDLKLEHGAFKAKGFDGLIARLRARGDRMQVVKVPGTQIVQVNVWDPDGNHLHIDFDAGEVDPSYYA